MTDLGHVVVLGAGQAGVQFADSLRAAGHTGPVTLLEQEVELPYQRPPLSKDHLTEQGAAAVTLLRGEDFYRSRDIGLRRGVRVIAIDRPGRRVRLADGAAVPYTTLVLATGSTNRVLDLPGADLIGVHGLRTRDDAARLRDALAGARSLVVVGAGFVGLEVAAVARGRGLPVTILEAAGRPLGRAASVELSEHVAAFHRGLGSTLLTGAGVAGIEGAGGRVTGVRDAAGLVHPAEVVLVGIGASPRDQLAQAAGLAVGGGVVVDGALRTSDPAVYAVGDCARFPSLHLGVPVRLESVQNAADQARHLAEHIAGHASGTLVGPPAAYATVPWFWSHQGTLRIQIAGLIAVDDVQVVRGDMATGRFSILSFRHDRLAAVESVNSPADHLAARRLLAVARPPTRAQATDPTMSLRDLALSGPDS